MNIEYNCLKMVTGPSFREVEFKTIFRKVGYAL